MFLTVVVRAIFSESNYSKADFIPSHLSSSPNWGAHRVPFDSDTPGLAMEL